MIRVFKGIYLIQYALKETGWNQNFRHATKRLLSLAYYQVMEWIDCSHTLKPSEWRFKEDTRSSDDRKKPNYIDTDLDETMLKGAIPKSLTVESMGWNKPVHFGIAKMETLIMSI